MDLVMIKRLFKIQTICWVMLLFSSASMASPFLVSDPSPTAIGGGYQILEALPSGEIIQKDFDYNQPDGSLKSDVAGFATGSHLIGVRYVVLDEFDTMMFSDFTIRTLVVTQSCVTVRRVKRCTKYFQLNP
jgi:hypothetical protein